MSCDVCGRLTTRLHSFHAYGLEGAGCDLCTHYEWEAFDEPRAQYLDEQIDEQEAA
jgi:hypothetical protein